MAMGAEVLDTLYSVPSALSRTIDTSCVPELLLVDVLPPGATPDCAP